MAEPIRIVVVIEGGVVQSVLTDAAQPEAVQVAVVDYDIDGVAPADLREVAYEDGSNGFALVSTQFAECEPTLTASACKAGGPETMTTYACQNCDWKGPKEALRSISDVFERVGPGEEMPAGECPDCGALAHAEAPAPAPARVPAQVKPEKPTATVGSNHAELTICLLTGDVLECRPTHDADCDLSGIYRFDLPEWERFWRKPLHYHFDILDLGYWERVADARSGIPYIEYTAPEDDWRDQVAKDLAETASLEAGLAATIEGRA